METARSGLEAQTVGNMAAAAAGTIGIFEADKQFSIPFFKSAFRVREYEALLRAFPKSTIYSTRTDALASEEFSRFLADKPIFAGRVEPFDPHVWPPVQLAYFVFLMNAFAFVHYLESYGTPFVLELYPGGGFGIGSPFNEWMLDRVTGLTSLRGVIVTQPLTSQHLVEHKRCSPDLLTFVFGGVFLDPAEAPVTRARARYGFGKETLDICFAAFRYGGRGESKGYDLFVAAAHQLARSFPVTRFHVIGNFDADTIPLDADVASRFRFHGTLSTAALADRYTDMDLVVSPNRPFVLMGAFDGFPTGCCIEASVQGTAVVCTDPLKQNRNLTPGEDIFLVEPEVDSLLSCLEQLARDPEAIRRAGENARTRFRQLFDHEEQMGPRRRLLAKALEGPAGPREGAARPAAAVHLYNASELSNGVKRVAPTDAAMRDYDYNYELFQVVYECIYVGCPELCSAPETILEMDLGRLGPDRLSGVQLLVHPHRPVPDYVPFPMELLLSLHAFAGEPALAEERLVIPADLKSAPVSVRASTKGRIRCLRIVLRLLPYATTNCNAAVSLTHIVATVRS
jgi:glycosyltransferase involved in cell wall biosynthesis